MYYRKFFSGTVDATTTTNQYYMGLDKVATGTSKGSGHIKNRSDVIGNALVSTLHDIGYPNAYWDSTSGYLFFDKTNSLCGVYISVQSSYLYVSVGYKGTSYITSASNTSSSTIDAHGTSLSTSNNPFEANGATATNYAFYVTIAGEPKGIFQIAIGAYANHTTEAGEFFMMCVGKDKRDNSSTMGFNLGKVSNPYQFTINKFSDADRIIQTSAFATQQNVLTLMNETIVLIPIFFQHGFLFLDNTFIKPGGMNVGFYEIDGDVYFVNQYYITKCITEV